MKVDIQTRTEANVVALVSGPTSEQPLPLVILLHGNTGWKEEAHLETLAKDLNIAGITTIRFDAPGSGESDGTWADDYRATNYIEATKDVYDWAINNLNIAPEKIGLWGHSMGGMVAVQVAAYWPELFSALCGCQPSTGRAPQTDDWEENGGFEMQTQIFGKVWLPKEFFIDRLQHVTAETVKKLKIPQLYIAGDADTLVPAQDVKKIFENANEPKQYKEFPTTHFYKDDQDMLKQVNEVTVAFFAKALLTD